MVYRCDHCGFERNYAAPPARLCGVLSCRALVSTSAVCRALSGHTGSKLAATTATTSITKNSLTGN